MCVYGQGEGGQGQGEGGRGLGGLGPKCLYPPHRPSPPSLLSINFLQDLGSISEQFLI